MITINMLGATEFVTNTTRNNIYYSTYSANTACTYCFEIKSLDTLHKKLFLVNDESYASDVYNVFRVTGTTSTENLSIGVVDFQPKGLYEYIIYSVTGDTLNDVDTSCVLEVGLFRIIND